MDAVWFMISTSGRCFAYTLALLERANQGLRARFRLGRFVLCIVGRAVPTNDDRALGSAFVTGILGARNALNRLVGLSATFRPGTQASERGRAGLANRLFDPIEAADDPGKGQEQYPAYCRRSDLSPG